MDSVIVDAVFYNAHAFSLLFFSEVDMSGLHQDLNIRLPIFTHKRYLKTFDTDG